MVLEVVNYITNNNKIILIFTNKFINNLKNEISILLNMY